MNSPTTIDHQFQSSIHFTKILKNQRVTSLHACLAGFREAGEVSSELTLRKVPSKTYLNHTNLQIITVKINGREMLRWCRASERAYRIADRNPTRVIIWDDASFYLFELSIYLKIYIPSSINDVVNLCSLNLSS